MDDRAIVELYHRREERAIARVGMIGVLDQLYQREYIDKEVYLECLLRLQEFNGGKVRLPAKEIGRRIEEIKADYNT